MTSFETPSASSLVAFDNWLAELGKTRVIGHRWRKQGLIETINIYGRLFLSRGAIADFKRRAMAGEFSRECKTPKRDSEK